MPAKFSKSFKEFQKGTKTTVMRHDYMKCKTKEFLLDYINDPSAKPKIRRKCLVELGHRGVQLNWKTKQKDTELDLT